MALLFEKPSARTRHSTEMAVVQLGGHPIYVRPDEVGIGVRGADTRDGGKMYSVDFGTRY